MTTPSPLVNLVAVSIGNTRTQLGLFVGDRLERTAHVASSETAAVADAVHLMWQEIADTDPSMIVLASVNDPVTAPIVAGIERRAGAEVFRIGDDLAVPVGLHLDPETITGLDRLLNAAAAWDRLKQACVVVDAGTAVTVDFVDGAGTFQGGAIAPGVQMQLDALHERTAALPAIAFVRPDPEPFGKNTRQAMLQGVFYGIRGLVWRLVEQYATAYGAFPLVVATGGDASAIFEGDELVNAIVPDLTLRGIAAAARANLSEGADA